MAEKRREFERGSIVLFVLLMLSNAVNYLFQILTGRFLNNAAEYGTLNALLSFFNLASLPVSIITMIVTKFIATMDGHDGREGAMKTFLKEVTKCVFVISILVTVLGIALSDRIGAYIHADHPFWVKLTIVGASVSYLISIVMGYFQGKKEFFSYGIYNLIAPVCKIACCSLLLYMGYYMEGILYSIVFSNLITVWIGFVWLKRIFERVERQAVDIGRRHMAVFSNATFMINMGLILLNNFDVIILKHYFVDEAGYYSTASVIGKLILYLTNAIVVAMFPFVAQQNSENSCSILMLKKALLYSGTIAVGALVILNVFGGFMIRVMYGGAYAEASIYLLPVSVLVMALSILTIIANYNLAIEKVTFITGSMLLSVAADVLLVFVYHEKMLYVAWMLAIILCMTAAVNVVRILWKGQVIKSYGKKIFHSGNGM